VLTFLQALIDASLLCLLQHQPSHHILQKILLRLESELTYTEQIEELRGPLEPFAKAAKAASEVGRGGPQMDWRKRRREAHEQTALTVGLYRLEELVL